MEIDAPEKKKRKIRIIAAVGMALLIVYPLSLGPYSWLAMHGYTSHTFGRIFYFPISFMAQQSDFVREAFTKYVRWWAF